MAKDGAIVERRWSEGALLLRWEDSLVFPYRTPASLGKHLCRVVETEDGGAHVKANFILLAPPMSSASNGYSLGFEALDQHLTTPSPDYIASVKS